MSKELPPLWTHQKEGASSIAQIPDRDGYALFMEVGTGKTPTAITGYRYLCARNGRLLRTLVFGPPIVRENWRREFLRFSNIDKAKISVLDGAGKNRVKKFKELSVAPHIFITNYESLLISDLYKLFMLWRPEVLIIDESHKVKSHKAKTTKAMIKLADNAIYKILLTGTPILNTPMDIWSQYRIMDGGSTFDRNFYAFQARYFEDKNAGMPSQKHFPNWQPRTGIEKIFNDLIYRKAKRVLKEECLDLPPIVRQRFDVELSSEQSRMYKSMLKDYVAYLNDKACVASIALTRGLRLQQMVSGFFVDDEGKEYAFKENPRLDLLKDLLEDIVPQSKVIVWTNFRHSYASIMGLCDSLGTSYRCILGGMTAKAVQESVDSFQNDPSVRVMIANPQAGGTGVTLTAAACAIYFSRGFSLEHHLQSQARNHRGGSEQHKKITYYDLVAPGTIDEVILEALERKDSLANNILRLRELL